MFKYAKQLITCTAFMAALVLSQVTFAAEKNASIQRSNLQDSKKAIQFFQQELEFTTNPHSIKNSIDHQDTRITIVDVRSAKDYAAGHIPGAINIPYEQHNGFEGNETEFKGLRKDGYNVVYCYELLCDLAKQAAIKFASLGYPVKEMQGGFNSWKEKGNPIEK